MAKRYTMIPLPATIQGNSKALDICNRLDQAGWELVAINKDENGLDLYWFKLRQPAWWEKLWEKLSNW